MDSTTDKNTINEEKEIDLLELGKKLWDKRKFILKVSLIGLIIGIIVAFSIPKEYTTTVILAPEAGSSGGGGNMGALAAMAGINLQQGTGRDIISPELYPDIIGSTPFLVGLFDIQVTDKKDEINTTLYDYLKEDQKSTWWSYIISAPFKVLELFSSKDKNIVMFHDTVNSRVINLSKDELGIIDAIKGRIDVSVDKKTNVITFNSTMQAAEISASIADTVVSYLQNYIIQYRTQKARKDLAFTEKLYEESKADYYKAQQKYATYSDENLGIVSARYATTRERLQSEMTLAYGVYNQMAQQLQMAKVKVQDTTPVYTIIQPAVVPLVPAKPNKKLIVIGFIFIAGIGACGWILAKDIFFRSKN